MGITPQPHTPYLVFIFFFTLSLAKRTTGSVTCMDDSLPYPFGHLIDFRCSTNGSAQIGEFSVEEVTDANIYVKIPPMCTRGIRKIEQLFGDNFAPSNTQNTLLLQGCTEPLYNCTINPKFLENLVRGSKCDFNSSVSCFDGTTTADVLSIEDVNQRGCKYWLSSVTAQFNDFASGTSLSFGRLKLDWWLQEGCGNTTCSKNANCTQVELPRGRLGHRCTCFDGFRGNAFVGGCQASVLQTRCSGEFSCGDQKELFYPFWNSERENCGHPDFKVECNTGFAEVSISSVMFRILESHYTTGVVKLARSDYMSDFCPQNPVNAPFSDNVLPYAPGTDTMTIYYNCSRDFSDFVSTHVKDLDCEDDGRRNYYVTRSLSSSLLEGNRGLLMDFRGSCRRSVSIPASRLALDTLETSPSTDNLKKLFTQGFVLGANQECSMCTESGGACGYSQALSRFACYCTDEQYNLTCSSGSRKKTAGISHGAIAGIVAGSVSVVAMLICIIVVFSCLISRRRKMQTAQYTSKDLSVLSYSSRETSPPTSDDLRQQNLQALIPLKQYSYAHVTRITKSFAEVVGKGGFGTVYRGTLLDGRLVAVKVLKESKGNGEDFINEVASMSKTSHVNIVSLLGFCAEGSKRAIIYEFVENGSLDKFMSSNTSMTMDWMALYGIALGVARGLEYLHYGCNTRIVHFDIKPSNVLVDKNLCPKVSDFGLAKLCEKKESIMSLLDTRGTIGYIAPEMISRVYGSVSHKSDVYSYGMLILEMIGARNKPPTENSASNPSSMYFPEWIYRDLEKVDDGRPIEIGTSSEDEEISKKMTLVGLWCIQSSPLNRPPMNKVVKMMEGSLEALEMPPRPVWQQNPATPFQESSLLSEDISVSI